VNPSHVDRKAVGRNRPIAPLSLFLEDWAGKFDKVGEVGEAQMAQ
jgi:hypothetical protein